jgi:Fe-S-cluster containining protein
MTELHEYCRMCGGSCCANPWLSESEYAVLQHFIGNDAIEAGHPVRVNGGWMFRAGRCPGALKDGCALSYPMRPLACRIYPFVSAEILNKTLKFETIPLLDVHICPYWHVFGSGAGYQDALKEIKNGK